MYNLADTSWRTQPKFVSDSTYESSLRRIYEHAQRYQLANVRIIFHGGEPFLAGAARLENWCRRARQMFDPSNIKLHLCGQTNGLLFNNELGKIFQEYGVTFGVSIDGIPGKGDRFRLDHKGNRVGSELQAKLLEIKASPYADLFAGIISVINFEAPAVETLEYLLQFDPPSIDFHPRLLTHDSAVELDEIPKVGAWFIDVFDYLVEHKIATRIRLLSSIGQAIVENGIADRTRGNAEIWSGLIETNGAFELIDSLKVTQNLMTKTKYNVFEHSVDELSLHIANWIPKVGLDTLPEECQRCPISHICKGGYYPHRYAAKNGFRNRDVYCNEWKQLIVHMYDRLNEIIESDTSTVASNMQVVEARL
jgi:uncharacterized protein